MATACLISQLLFKTKPSCQHGEEPLKKLQWTFLFARLDRKKEVVVESSDDEGAPRISLQEMLDDLRLTDDDEEGHQAALLGQAAAMATQ